MGFEHKSGAAGAQAGMMFNEFVGGKAEKFGHGVNFLRVHTDEAGPAAAVAAALTEVAGIAHAFGVFARILLRRQINLHIFDMA